MNLDKLRKQIDGIETRRQQLDAQKQKLEARLKTNEKKRDTRRKILLGALVLDSIEGEQPTDPMIAEWVKEHLPDFLTRDGDKAIFQDIIGPSGDGTPTGEAAEDNETDNDETAGAEATA